MSYVIKDAGPNIFNFGMRLPKNSMQKTLYFSINSELIRNVGCEARDVGCALHMSPSQNDIFFHPLHPLHDVVRFPAICFLSRSDIGLGSA